MNFSGIITLPGNVKDLPFHQNAATERVRGETGVKPHLLAPTAIK